MEDTKNMDTLKSELDYFRQNQALVEREINVLISDNQKLSQQVGALLKEKLENAKNNSSNDQDLRKELENYRKQVILLTKERDSLHVLWQTAQKTIDALEVELTAYQGHNRKEYQQNIYEEKRDLQIKLETALSDYLELETKDIDLKLKKTTVETQLKYAEREINMHKDKSTALETKVNELSKALEELKITSVLEKKDNEELRIKLAETHTLITDSTKKETEAKQKVAEALQLYDEVAKQKDSANKRMKELTDELMVTKNDLHNIKRDTELLFRKEADGLKEKYNEKISDMLEHIRILDKELVEKGILLNKALREIKIQQTTNEELLAREKDAQRMIDPRISAAEQRLEAMYQELIDSERRNIQVLNEKQCLAMDMQNLQDLHTREMKRLKWEEQLLQTECEEKKLQVEHLEKSLEDAHDMVNKLQEMLNSKTQFNLKVVKSKDEEVNELNKHLQKQMELSTKWKESYVDMTEKMKKRLDELQKENENLRQRLEEPQNHQHQSHNESLVEEESARYEEDYEDDTS